MIEQHIQKAINKAINEILEQEIESAKKSLENKLRERAAQITISIAEWAEIETLGNQIRVTFTVKEK